MPVIKSNVLAIVRNDKFWISHGTREKEKINPALTFSGRNNMTYRENPTIVNTHNCNSYFC
jgi:hypothetical protein